MPTRILIPAGQLLGLLLLSALLLDVTLFQSSEYNVYKVLELQLSDTLIIGAFLVVQILFFHSFFKQYFPTDILKSAIVTLLALAFFDASLAFWIHEENNEGVHLNYAKKLALEEDIILEEAINSLIATEKGLKINESEKVHWERLFLANEYLAANYQFKYLANLENTSHSYYQPIATTDIWGKRQYWVYFPGNCGIVLTLKDQGYRSVYTNDSPYKGLKKLHQFHFVVVKDSRIVLKNTHNFDNGVLDVALPDKIGEHKKSKWRGHDILVYRHSEQLYVLIGEPFSEFLLWWSNFAFFFGYSLLLALLLRGITHLMRGQSIKTIWRKLPIQHRIQAVILGLTIVLFFVIAAVTFLFIHENNEESRMEQNLRKAEYIRKKIASNELSHKGIRKINTDLLINWALRMKGDIDLYNANGSLLASSFASLNNTRASKVIDQEILKKIASHTDAIISQDFKKDNLEFFKTYIGISDRKQLLGVAVFSIPKTSMGYAQSIPMLMSSLLNVYVALLLLTWLVGLYMTNLLNKPLRLLAKRLSAFKIGQRNDLLHWEGDDAIGSLIKEYNKMVHTVELTTQELMEVEREGAWKTMAQQIAHEINNPLTPLKLKIQFLDRAFIGQEKPDTQAIRRVTDSLIDQIDQLASTAEQFKLFAKMGTPKANPLSLTDFMGRFVDKYSQEYGRHTLSVTEDNIMDDIIRIDEKHFTIVLQNIVQFMTPLLAEEDSINIQLTRKEHRTAIVLSAAEMDIPQDHWKTIFDPSFIIKSGQSGLGLPICRRIVEFYGGQLDLLDQHTFCISFSDDKLRLSEEQLS